MLYLSSIYSLDRHIIAARVHAFFSTFFVLFPELMKATTPGQYVAATQYTA
ncbi:MAG: hypothetical protein ABJL67_22825 [Sulfitobacter sp.]